MADILWPPHIVPNTMQWQIIDSTAAFNSPTSGYTRTASTFGVRRWGTSINKDNLRTTDRSYITGLIARLQGRAGRIYIPCFPYVQRGAFAAPELLSNNTFDNGTTGWSSYGSDSATLTASNRVLRATELGYHSYGFQRTGIAATQYGEYVLRAMMMQGRGGGIPSPYVGEGTRTEQVFGASGQSGLFTTAALNTVAGSIDVGVYMGPTPGPYLQGDYFTVPYLSLARVLQVDARGNSLVYSKQYDNAVWTKNNATAGANVSVGPDGATTADTLIENGSAGTHYFTQANISIGGVANDFFFCVEVKAGTRNFVMLEMAESTSSTLVNQYFNLSTGAVGTNGSTGANWVNRRAFIKPLGNSWYLCCVGARKTNNATVAQGTIYAASADGTISYTGSNGSAALSLGNAGFLQSSVPFNPTVNSATNLPLGASVAGASGIYVKGGRTPQEASGLAGALLAGDIVEIILPNFSQLVRLTADLDLANDGTGYLQFEPALRQAPVDGAAIIVNNPMGRFMSADGTIEWDNKPGPGGNPLTDTSINFVESVQ